MYIEYSRPLSNAWIRAKRMLFQPFDLSKWLALGFTAFLSGLFESGGGGGSGRSHADKHNPDWDWEQIREFPEVAWQWLQNHPTLAVLIFIGVLILIAMMILCTWLGSRGKFMFLDNVVHNRSDVTRPWHAFKAAGNSLFVWRLIYGLICLVMYSAFFVLSFQTLYDIWQSYESGALMVLPAIIAGLVFLLLLMITGTVSWLLNDFIVPVMYKHDISVTRAWSRFLPLFFGHILNFLIYGLLLLGIQILFTIFVILAGIFTCCIGFFLLAAPFISSVITLPYSVTLRGFSLEFLAQFGPDFKVFPEAKATVMV